MLPMQYSTTEQDQQRITNNSIPEMGPVKLLTSAHLVDDTMIEKATKMSFEQRRPVGDVLVDLKAISQELLQAALLTQALVNQGQLRPSQATVALNRYADSNQNIVEIINDLTGRKNSLVNDLGLGALLIAGELITMECYRQAISDSAESNMPLGKTLLAKRIMTLPGLDSAIYLANQVQSGAMDLSTAAKALKKATVNNRPARELLLESRLFKTAPAEGPMLGGFLVEAGAIKESEMVEALEVSLLSGNRIGETLVQQGVLTRDLLDGAVKLQRMVVCGMLKLEDGVKCLRRAKVVASHSQEIIRNAAKMICCCESATDLARQAGVLKQGVDHKTKLMQELSGLAALETLFITYDLPPQLYKTIVQTSRLVEECTIDQGQAIQVVDVCERVRCSFDEAIAQLGWKIYDQTEQELPQYESKMKVAKPKLFDGCFIFQLLFNVGASLGAGALMHQLLLPQYHVLGVIVILFVALIFATTTICGAVSRCRKQMYERDVNAQAAILTKDKLKNLRTGCRAV
jgi:hypothetical protein